MKQIPLTRGRYALVDDGDYEELNRHKWHASWNPTNRSYYAKRRVGRVMVRMHREICELKPGDRKEVDHINHDTLDNRRSNLRVCVHQENSQNRCDQSRWGPGVRLLPNGRFDARLTIDGKRESLGTYDDPADAREVYWETYSALKEGAG